MARPKEWPSHGRAKDARDYSAEWAYEIRKEADTLMDLRYKGKLTDVELLYRLGVISRKASDILRLLEDQGAPTRAA